MSRTETYQEQKRREDESILHVGMSLQKVSHLILSACASDSWGLLDWKQISQYTKELMELALDSYEGTPRTIEEDTDGE